MRLVNEKNQYEQATGPEEDILHENIQFYTEIPVYTCIYKKEIKKNRLYLLKIICKKSGTNTQI